jgi:hypothetical protein
MVTGFVETAIKLIQQRRMIAKDATFQFVWRFISISGKPLRPLAPLAKHIALRPAIGPAASVPTPTFPGAASATFARRRKNKRKTDETIRELNSVKKPY